MKGKIFCIGYLGFVCERDVISAIVVLEVILRDLGYEFFILGEVLVVVFRVLVEL